MRREVRTTILATLVAALVFGGALALSAEESTYDIPAPSAFEEVTQPVDNVNMHPAYARVVAKQAYIWGWPMANQFNRREVIANVAERGRIQGVVPAGPRSRIGMLTDYITAGQTFVACPNQDVVYGYGFGYVDEEPVVIQIPEIPEDRFWIVAVWNARTDSVAKLGLQYGTKPGYYVVVGPNWKGDLPEGITGVVRSSTELVTIIPRLFMDDTEEDRKAVQPLVNQFVTYPLAEFDGTWQTFDYSKTPDLELKSEGSGEMSWVNPETFFDQLGTILDKVPPLPGEEAMYAQYRQLLAIAERDPAIKKAIVEAAVEAEKEVIQEFFKWARNGTPAGNGWTRSTHNAEWGVDYFNRTGTARSNIYDNRNAETQYMYTDNDADGNALVGSNSYSVTFAKGELPPVNAFWSLTLYNEGHIFHPNDLDRYSLGTKNKTLKFNDNGSLTLYAGANSPGKDKESNWLPAPDGSFSLYLRFYLPKESVVDGTWMPPGIVKMK